MAKTLKEQFVSFRKLVPEIPTTTYGIFGSYKYPAKFIPQVVAYILREYGKKGMEVFDPFAGCGTTGLVAKMYGFNYEIWDLNPILYFTHALSSLSTKDISLLDIVKMLETVPKTDEQFVPEWRNLEYWFPDEFLPLIFKAWGFVYSLPPNIQHFFLIPLLKTTKYFSFADEKVHKLYKSKYSVKKVEDLLKSNYQEKFYQIFRDEVCKLYRKIEEYEKLAPKPVSGEVKAGIDILKTTLDKSVNFLITSPPYLQAQEYIRSTKMELFFLGYKENYIRELSKKEIPYREVEDIEIYSQKYHKFRQEIREEHLLRLYDRYFKAILHSFSSLGRMVENYMFIFVARAKIRGIPIPVDEIIIEHLSEFGWEHQITYIDKIAARVMFKSKINPATGIQENRIDNERLLVLERRTFT